MVNDECLVCGAPLEYLQEDEIMECALCHKKMASRTRCVKGHFVCDECHTSGMDSVMAVCLRSGSKDCLILKKVDTFGNNTKRENEE
ncbi:MAG: hypothetical protein SPL42_10350, partial [Bacteroidales bacterium]|nr:hypothetical protein [Bacteroidales bacterium]